MLLSLLFAMSVHFGFTRPLDLPSRTPLKRSSHMQAHHDDPGSVRSYLTL